MAGLIANVTDLKYRSPRHFALHAEAIGINRARCHLERENGQCLEQWLPGSGLADAVERVREGRRDRSRRGKLPTVGHGRNLCKWRIRARIAQGVEERAV